MAVVEQRYSPGVAGWVIRTVATFPARPSTKGVGGGILPARKATQIVSWWYGPRHGFGTTSGGLDYSVAVFPTRRAAEDAARSVYGRGWRRRRLEGDTRQAVRVADAEAEVAARKAAAR